jgi:arylformamidase
MPVWPGDPGFQRTLYQSFEEGGSYEASMIRMGSHTGTHIDAPAHFLQGGSTIDTVPLDKLIGKVIVVQVDVPQEITRSHIESLYVEGYERILFKTRNSALYQSDEFTSDFVYLTLGAAQHLVDLGMKLVGIDYLSVGEYHSGADVHQTLLGSGAVVLETINLADVPPGEYEIMCLPLKVQGSDGAPARAVLCELG